MSTYRVIYGNGAITDVQLDGSHVPPAIVLEEARKKNSTEPLVPAVIIRDPGTPAERVVWRRLSANRNEDVVELPTTVRLFVSFSYDHPEEKRTVFGSTVLDMDFEPYEPEHIDHLRAQIATHIGAHRVVVMSWQKFGRQA